MHGSMDLWIYVWVYYVGVRGLPVWDIEFFETGEEKTLK